MGFFRVSRDGDALLLEVQLRDRCAPSAETEDRLTTALRAALPPDLAFHARLFRGEEFPQRTTHERKHHYILT
jgi:hypothetical protein